MNKPIEENLKLIDTKYESPEEEIYKIEKTLFNLDENLEQTEENIKKQLFQLSLKNIVPDISELRLANLSEQIYRLELTQFSESITRIQLNKKTNDYLIHFDKTENIPAVLINKKDFEQLISYRDRFYCPSITEAFSKNEDIMLHPNKQHKDGSYTIGKYFLPSYNMCHHCKILKPNEDLFKCRTSLQNYDNDNKSDKIMKDIKIIFIYQSITLVKEKVYFLKNFEGNIKDLINDYFSSEKYEIHQCGKYYCETCLKSIYDFDIDELFNQTFICPSCRNICTCSRCLRQDELIKIIGTYISLGGGLDKLYSELIDKNCLFEILIDYLHLSKFIILNFEKDNIEKVPIKKATFNQIMNYKKVIENYQNYVGSYFEKCKKEKKALFIDNEWNNPPHTKTEDILKNENFDKFGKTFSFLHKKRKNEPKNFNDLETLSSSDDVYLGKKNDNL